MEVSRTEPNEKKYVINIKFHSKDPTYFDQWGEEANCIMHDVVACPHTRSFTLLRRRRPSSPCML